MNYIENSEFDSDSDSTDDTFDDLMNLIEFNPDIHRIKALITPENINRQDSAGQTPLFLAAINSRVSGNNVVKLLLDSGTDVNIQNYNGWTALMVSTRNSETDSTYETVRLLLERNPDVNMQNNTGWTALMLAARNSNTDSSYKTLKLLLEHGVDINIQNHDGWTALMYASRNSNSDSSYETVKLLLEHGADVNIQNYDGWTALMHASKYSNRESTYETVKLLLEHGADVNIQNYDGWTALMHAARSSNTTSTYETVKLLLEYGAEPYQALEFCPTNECSKIVSTGIWKRIHSNVTKLSKQYSNSTMLSKDIWALILWRVKQRQLCSSLSNSNIYVLIEFAEMLDIPITPDMSKPEICSLISRQISWGEKYSEESIAYFRKKDNRLKLSNLAVSMGLNPDQPLDTLINQIVNLVS